VRQSAVFKKVLCYKRLPTNNSKKRRPQQMTREKRAQRKRGVRASRTSLTHALAEAGLRTQAALAERIADLEGLDAAPKDVVSRVFRELPVEPQTLERVARALGVAAYTLYMTTGEEAQQANLSESPATIRDPRRRQWPMFAASVVAVLLLAGGWWFSQQPPAGATTPFRPLGLGTPTLTVLPIAGDTNAALADALRTSLGDSFTVATVTAAVLTRELDPASTSKRLRTDAVVDGEIVTVGRLSAVRLYIFASGVRRQIWAESLPTVALADAFSGIASRASLAIRQATGMPVPKGTVPHFPLAPVQDDYLEGEYFLDRPSNELNVRRAQNHFEAALRQDANFARAHAGLCQTLLEAHWMDDEEAALRDAARACGQALQLDRDDSVVAGAHAHFLSRTGRNDEAIALYERVLEANPNDAAVLAGLASSRLQAFQQGGDRAMLVAAKVAAQRAAIIDPFVWKPLFALATMEWFDGNIAAAIAASEAAIERDENEFILANLGTFYLCNGAIDEAREAYSRARELDPGSYVGDEFLGMAYYFLGDFDRSVTLRRRAIEAVAAGQPEIHEMWGNLGDSYRQAGEHDEAVAAYRRAAEIAERDHLRGTAPVSDRAARAYYYTMLASLEPDAVPRDIARMIDDEIDAVAEELASATALRRMAQTYLERGNIDKARETLARATDTCRGYASYPDLVVLRRDAD
jgi:tetratricopeptide (TPR) repeat protein